MLKESFLHSCQNWLKTPQMIPFFVVFLGFNNFLALTASGNYLKSLLKQNPTVICGHSIFCLTFEKVLGRQIFRNYLIFGGNHENAVHHRTLEKRKITVTP